jgi:hypothetical protein
VNDSGDIILSEEGMHMPKPPRRLLMIAGICCVVPLLGANAPVAAANSDCPYARAEAAALAAASQGPTAAIAVTDVSRVAPWLVP